MKALLEKERMLSVTAICDGTVIDHIRAGQGLRIVRLLKLLEPQSQVTVGFYLKSASMGLKDLIKVERVYFTAIETAQIALFAPSATVNLIRDCQVVEKYQVRLPEESRGILPCPNRACMTNLEQVPTRFTVIEAHGHVQLRCYFCEKIHPHDEIAT